MLTPTISINGTHPMDLLEMNMSAYDALYEAIKRLREAYPNGRDYPDINQAMDEHRARISRLLDVHNELGAIVLAISDQIP